MPDQQFIANLEEARKVFLGLSQLYRYQPGISQEFTWFDSDTSRPSNAYSQKYRAVEAGIVDLLFEQDPEADDFEVRAKEAMGEELQSFRFSDLCCLRYDPYQKNIEFAEENTWRTLLNGLKISKEDFDNWDYKFESLQGISEENQKKIKEEFLRLFAETWLSMQDQIEGEIDLEQFCEDYPYFYNFMTANLEEIKTEARDIDEFMGLQEKWEKESRELRDSPQFWESVRVTVEANSNLVEKVRASLLQAQRG